MPHKISAISMSFFKRCDLFIPSDETLQRAVSHFVWISLQFIVEGLREPHIQYNLMPAVSHSEQNELFRRKCHYFCSPLFIHQISSKQAATIHKSRKILYMQEKFQSITTTKAATTTLASIEATKKKRENGKSE